MGSPALKSVWGTSGGIPFPYYGTSKGDQMPQRLLPDVTLSLSDVKKSFQGCDRDNRFLCTLVLPTQG